MHSRTTRANRPRTRGTRERERERETQPQKNQTQTLRYCMFLFFGYVCQKKIFLFASVTIKIFFGCVCQNMYMFNMYIHMGTRTHYPCTYYNIYTYNRHIIHLGPLNSLVWQVPCLRYTRGLGWRMHCGVEVTESSTNEQHHLSLVVVGVAVTVKVHATHCSTGCRAAWRGASTSRRAIRSGNGRRPCPSSSGRCGSTRLRRRRCCKIFRCPTSPRRRAGTHSLKRTLVVTFSTLYDDCLVLYLSMSTGLMTVAYSSTVGDSMMTVSFI